MANSDGKFCVYALKIDDLITLAKSRPTRSLAPDECRQYLRLETCPAEP